MAGNRIRVRDTSSYGTYINEQKVDREAYARAGDRLRLGYVVDFIRFHWRREVPFLGSEWPTFNIADVTITLGVILLLIDGWIEGREEKARERAAKARAEEAGEAAEA